MCRVRGILADRARPRSGQKGGWGWGEGGGGGGWGAGRGGEGGDRKGVKCVTAGWTVGGGGVSDDSIASFLCRHNPTLLAQPPPLSLPLLRRGVQ